MDDRTYHPVLLRGDELRALLDQLTHVELSYTPLGIGKLKLEQAMALQQTIEGKMVKSPELDDYGNPKRRRGE